MSRRGTTPNPLPLGSFSPFSQFASQNQQQPKARNNTLAPRASPLAKSPFGPGGALSVEEWEIKAPLSDIQVRSVASVKKASEYTKIPDKVDSIFVTSVPFSSYFHFFSLTKLLLIKTCLLDLQLHLLVTNCYHPDLRLEHQVFPRVPELHHALALNPIINSIQNILYIPYSNSMIGML